MKIISVKDKYILRYTALELTFGEPAGVKDVAKYLKDVVNVALDTSYYISKMSGMESQEQQSGRAEYIIGEFFITKFVVQGCEEPALTHDLYALGAPSEDRDKVFKALKL